MHLMRDALPEVDRRSLLIAGVGSEYGGGDRAGLVAARRLRDLLPDTRVIETSNPLSLLGEWAAVDTVILIDAMRSGRPPGTVVRFEGDAIPFRPAGFASTHGFSVVDAIALARETGCMPRHLIVYGIEAGDTAAVSRGIARTVRECAACAEPS